MLRTTRITFNVFTLQHKAENRATTGNACRQRPGYDEVSGPDSIEEDHSEEHLKRLYDIYDLEVESGRMFGGDEDDTIRDLDSIKDKLERSDSNTCLVQARSVLGEAYTRFVVDEYDGELRY